MQYEVDIHKKGNIVTSIRIRPPRGANIGEWAPGSIIETFKFKADSYQTLEQILKEIIQENSSEVNVKEGAPINGQRKKQPIISDNSLLQEQAIEELRSFIARGLAPDISIASKWSEVQDNLKIQNGAHTEQKLKIMSAVIVNTLMSDLQDTKLDNKKRDKLRKALESKLAKNPELLYKFMEFSDKNEIGINFDALKKDINFDKMKKNAKKLNIFSELNTSIQSTRLGKFVKRLTARANAKFGLGRSRS